EIMATPPEPPDGSTSAPRCAFSPVRRENQPPYWPPMNADERRLKRARRSFPERTKCTKARRPRPPAAGKRVSPRPAWLTERPEARVRKDLAAFFEFFTPLYFCVAR